MPQTSTLNSAGRMVNQEAFSAGKGDLKPLTPVKTSCTTMSHLRRVPAILLAIVQGEKGRGGCRKRGLDPAHAITAASTPFHSLPAPSSLPPCPFHPFHCLNCSGGWRQLQWQIWSADTLYGSAPTAAILRHQQFLLLSTQNSPILRLVVLRT